MIDTNELPAGFTVRPVTREDVSTAVALINACYRAEVGTDALEEAEMLNEWGTPGFDLDADARAVIAPDGSMAAYGEFWNITEPRVRPHLFARVLPQHCGKGIGTYLLRWGEARARSYIPEIPSDARMALRAGAFHTSDAALTLFANEGFTHVRTFYRMRIDMDAAPPEPVWPDGIRVRTVRGDDEADLRAAYEADDEAFRDHWGHLPIGFEKWLHWITNDPDFDPTLYFLAMDGNTIAATCFCRPKVAEDLSMAWVDDLGVRRPWRRRGLGQALLLHAFGEFWRRGQRKVGLGVDATSLTNATRLYEKVGMRIYRDTRVYEKELRPGVELSTQTVEE